MRQEVWFRTSEDLEAFHAWFPTSSVSSMYRSTRRSLGPSSPSSRSARVPSTPSRLAGRSRLPRWTLGTSPSRSTTFASVACGPKATARLSSPPKLFFSSVRRARTHPGSTTSPSKPAASRFSLRLRSPLRTPKGNRLLTRALLLLPRRRLRRGLANVAEEPAVGGATPVLIPLLTSAIALAEVALPLMPTDAVSKTNQTVVTLPLRPLVGRVWQTLQRVLRARPGPSLPPPSPLPP